jgi:hypothetical protein
MQHHVLHHDYRRLARHKDREPASVDSPDVHRRRGAARIRGVHGNGKTSTEPARFRGHRRDDGGHPWDEVNEGRFRESTRPRSRDGAYERRQLRARRGGGGRAGSSHLRQAESTTPPYPGLTSAPNFVVHAIRDRQQATRIHLRDQAKTMHGPPSSMAVSAGPGPKDEQTSDDEGEQCCACAGPAEREAAMAGGFVEQVTQHGSERPGEDERDPEQQRT